MNADETPIGPPPFLHLTEPGPPSPPSEQGTTPDERALMARSLMDFAAAAPLDELALLVELKNRILRGRKTYGAWVAKNEGRDLDREQLEEHLDAQVYGAIRAVKGKR
jgi:hypothetical protein